MPNGQDDETRTQTLLLVTGAGALLLGFLALQAARKGAVACPIATGTLVKANAAVWAIVDADGGCIKRHVISRDVMNACGYKFEWIFSIDQATLDSIPTGPPLTGPPCPPIPNHAAEPPGEEAPPPIPTPEPPPTGAISYTIVSGDTLWGIATRFCGAGICWWWLWQQNLAVVGSNPNLIFPGQVLTIPQPCPSPCPLPEPGPVPCGGTYTVIAGDTLSSIAQRAYGDANQWPRIFDANRAVIGSDPNLIFPGQQLFIPPPC